MKFFNAMSIVSAICALSSASGADDAKKYDQLFHHRVGDTIHILNGREELVTQNAVDQVLRAFFSEKRPEDQEQRWFPGAHEALMANNSRLSAIYQDAYKCKHEEELKKIKATTELRFRLKEKELSQLTERVLHERLTPKAKFTEEDNQK